jgi:outer membrane protein assembly factor BamB
MALDVVRADQNAENARATLVNGDEALRQAREALGLALGIPEETGVAREMDVSGIAEDALRSCRNAARGEARLHLRVPGTPTTERKLPLPRSMRPLLLGLMASAAACASGLGEAPVGPNAVPSKTDAVEPTPSVPVATPQPTAQPSEATAEVPLPHMWKTVVGRTDAHTTMALAGNTVVIGTHGGSFDAIDEATDGVYLLDGVSGRVIRMIATPGRGRQDVNGIAVDAGRVFFSTGNGQVVAAELDGRRLWERSIGAEVLAAPTLVEVNGDGTLDAVVGDAGGGIHALDGRTGKVLWSRSTNTPSTPRPAIEAGIAAGDLDGDGVSELVTANWEGTVESLRSSTGQPIWSSHGDGRVRASPVLVDVNGDGKLEVIVAWETGAVRILDGATGRELWSTVVGQRENVHVHLLGSPIPFIGAASGELAVPVGREPAGDGLFLLGEHDLSLRSGDSRVLGTPVVTSLVPNGTENVVFGTGSGELVSISPAGRRSTIARLGGPIEASVMVADVDGDGLYEILVASNDGVLTCVTTRASDAPAVGRFRGDSPTNNGLLRPTNLRWALAQAPDLASK